MTTNTKRPPMETEVWYQVETKGRGEWDYWMPSVRHISSKRRAKSIRAEKKRLYPSEPFLIRRITAEVVE